MKFVSSGLNGVYLQELAERAHTEANCRHVQAAIAYASGHPKLFELCKQYKTRLEFWCRIDQTVPVRPAILKDFLSQSSLNYVCKVVPDIFHAKVIWWHGYGIYIGSANLTDRAWLNNIEAGVFIEEAEFLGEALEVEMRNFFQQIDSRSHFLTQEIYEQQEKLFKIRAALRDAEKNIEDDYEKNRRLPRNTPLNFVHKQEMQSRRRDEFLKEWAEALNVLRIISSKLDSEYRPAWVPEGVAPGLQTDRFLHAYYDEFVKEGNKAMHKERYHENRDNPDQALYAALLWWKNLPDAPENVYERINVTAPYLKNLLSKEKIKSLSREEFMEFCSNIFAIADNSLQISYKRYGLTEPLPKMDAKARVEYLANWLFNWRTSENRTVLDTLFHVLYGGDWADVPARIWDAVEREEYKIKHLSIGSLGEIVGWAMPDKFSPRNGRISKALRALGYGVRVYGDSE
jgi:hypothetical protein